MKEISVKIKPLLSSVTTAAKSVLSGRLKYVILFGSYARGDFDEQSDIDIMILADITDSQVNFFTRDFYDRLYEIEPYSDIVLSLCIVPLDRFEKYKTVLPFYKNVCEEGIRIAI